MYNSSLSKLFSEFPFTHTQDFQSDPPITSISADSRQVQPGGLFVAVSGESVDGHQFIPLAIFRGAAAVVGEQPLKDLAVPYIRVDNSRQSLASLAAAFYDFPARKMTMIGVTGTDGKTTTCNILYQILLSAGFKTGLISTVNAVIGSEVLDTGFHVTTPDAPEVQRYLSNMVEAGLTHVILETTSHGWAQNRVDACEFDIGVVTNITHEHLDYHGSYEKYRAAKARLLTGLSKTLPKKVGNSGLAVLNLDDSSYEYLKKLDVPRFVTYGLTGSADVHAENIRQTSQGICFTVCGNGFRFEVTSNLFGAFNVSNCLAAVSAAVVGLKIDPQAVAQGIANLPGVPGRMEMINQGQDFMAIVDFAHTPNALRVSLETARLILAHNRSGSGKEKQRVIAVFGSAGLRDREKRRMMAEVSAELADISILTAEDPRTESLDDILEEMAAGARGKGGVESQTFWRVKDRGEAIRLALKLARTGDLVISCGKGHEQSMCFGTKEYPWDDRIALRAALAEYLKQPGPLMPYLPTQEKA